MLDERAIAATALGDILTLPSGQSLTVRSRVSLSLPVGAMAGFLLLGEMEMILSNPSISGAPLPIYLPVTHIPPSSAHARSAAEGATRYWSPHLPALGQAMGEIFYRVLEVRGSTDPVVVIYRGPESVPFVRSGFVWPGDLTLLAMPRDAANEHVTVERHTAEVRVVPAYAPAPAEVYRSFTTK
jgi:hypothetical protein